MTRNYSLGNRPPFGGRHRVDIRTMMEHGVVLASDIVGQVVFGTLPSRRNWVLFGSSSQPARVCFGSRAAVGAPPMVGPQSEDTPRNQMKNWRLGSNVGLLRKIGCALVRPKRRADSQHRTWGFAARLGLEHNIGLRPGAANERRANRRRVEGFFKILHLAFA